MFIQHVQVQKQKRKSQQENARLRNAHIRRDLKALFISPVNGARIMPIKTQFFEPSAIHMDKGLCLAGSLFYFILQKVMGLFSWITADTRRSICSRNSNRDTFLVYMHGLLPDGFRVAYREDWYEGYGDFGEADYFVLLSRMNPPLEELTEEGHRLRGIYLSYDKEAQFEGIKFPQLTECQDVPESFAVQCMPCPEQGYFYSADSEDDDESQPE